MHRWRQGSSDSVSVRAFAISLAWIVGLLGGYLVLAEWSELPALASSVLSLAH